MKVCDKDCLHCQHDDCINDELDEVEVYQAYLRDKEMNPKEVDTTTAHYRYNHSYKRKLVNARYLASEKGKENSRRSWKKQAELHPDRIRARSRIYYAKHKDELKAKRLAKKKEKELEGANDARL